MKKFIAVLLSATTIFTYSTSVFADQSKTIEISQSMEIKNAKKNRIEAPKNVLLDNTKSVFIDDKQIELKEGSIVYEDRIFLPIREISDALGLEVGYVEEQKIVTLNGGKIQLPINQNKAVVNGKILAIDKENDKVGTIVVKNKTYLPLRFISESIGYSVDYNSNSGQINIKASATSNTTEKMATNETKLDKDKAVEAYKEIYKVSENIKNATIDMNGDINFVMQEGQDKIDMKINISGTTSFDKADKVSMYSDQKTTMEIMDTEETIKQQMFYQDGNLYVNKDGIKYKMELNLDDAMEKSNFINPDDLLDELLIIGGSVKNLENGNKQYTFDLNMDKAIEATKLFTEELGLSKEDEQVLSTLKIKNINVTISVDSKNQPVDYKVVMDMNLSIEGIDTTFNINMDMKYKDIGNTVVKAINEDLSQYKDFEEVANNVVS